MRCSPKAVAKKLFLILGFFLVLYVISYIENAWSGTTVTDDPQSLFYKSGELFSKLDDDNSTNPMMNTDHLRREVKIFRRLQEPHFVKEPIPLTGTNRDLTSRLYGEGCRDNPFRKRLGKLLKYWTKLVRAHNMEYFLCYGSLLGYHRTGDVIPYDHDVDVCLNQRDFERLSKLEAKRPFRFRDGQPHLIIQRSSSNGSALTRTCLGKWTHNKTDPCSIVSPPARVILEDYNFLDVYPYRVDERYAEKTTLLFLPQDIYPITWCMFLNRKTRCPHNTTALLSSWYGAEFATKPHHVCRNKQWVATGKNVTTRKLQWVLNRRRKYRKKKKKPKKKDVMIE